MASVSRAIAKNCFFATSLAFSNKRIIRVFKSKEDLIDYLKESKNHILRSLQDEFLYLNNNLL